MTLKDLHDSSTQAFPPGWTRKYSAEYSSDYQTVLTKDTPDAEHIQVMLQPRYRGTGTVMSVEVLADSRESQDLVRDHTSVSSWFESEAEAEPILSMMETLVMEARDKIIQSGRSQAGA